MAADGCLVPPSVRRLPKGVGSVSKRVHSVFAFLFGFLVAVTGDEGFENLVETQLLVGMMLLGLRMATTHNPQTHNPRPHNPTTSPPHTSRHRYKKIHTAFPDNVDCLTFLCRICKDMGMEVRALTLYPASTLLLRHATVTYTRVWVRIDSARGRLSGHDQQADTNHLLLGEVCTHAALRPICKNIRSCCGKPRKTKRARTCGRERKRRRSERRVDVARAAAAAMGPGPARPLTGLVTLAATLFVDWSSLAHGFLV
jgi:hypothetical protein